MPLVRLEIRNEYKLGAPELRSSVAGGGREDPKAVMDGVAVAGLVGILRQLGDLAEFAAEVFHGLQEQVITTSCRSHNLVLRLQRIEAALPPLEKAILAQTSHIHFAYTPGSEWHPRIRNERNHFIHNDLPHFIMDPYEECRGPPRLHLLDKFDTGGPGSCLKRYSDPTFFKRVSPTDESSAEKSHRDRKARRSKKKRSSSKQFGDVSRGASMSSARNYSLIPPIVGGQSSSSHTPSTIDPGLKYDQGDNLNSFGSRAESGFIECVFRPSSSKQAEEQEPNDSPSYNMVQPNAGNGLVSHDEHAGFADDSFPRSSLQEQMTSTSSCVTWDEKAEIMELKTKENGVNEILHAHRNETEDADLCGPHEDGNSPIVHQIDMFGDDDTRESVSSQNGIDDDIDSEPDNYLDALNTIESESENDLDYRTKRRFSSISRVGGAEGMCELTVHCSDQHAPTFESRTDSLVSSSQRVLSEPPDLILSASCGIGQKVVSDFSTEKQLHLDFPDSRSSESYAFEQAPQMGRESSANNIATITEISDVPEGSELEPAKAETSSSATRTTDIQDWPPSNKIVFNVDEPQESTTDASSNSSVKIWTNGGLLGLMPSKPPDFSMASPVNRDFMNSSKPNLVTPLDSVPRNSNDLYMQNGFAVSKGNDLKETSMLGTGKSLPVALNVKPRATETAQDNSDNSSLVFGLSRRLLSNGFGRKVSNTDAVVFEPAASVSDNTLDLYQTIDSPNPTVSVKSFKEQFGYGFNVSPTASPPLEHMKFSFHPVDGFEASKLKLKFSDGTQSQEKIRDMFPSFQLIPEAANPHRDCNSDSDDDTFCRSSPFMSDDCLSRQSESNSEQWEYGEPTDGPDNDVYDALCGISSMELVPSPLELDGMPNKGVFFDGGVKRENYGTEVESSICNPILDLPSFDAVKPALQQADSSPMPPPLPPMEWRASKPEVDGAKDKSDFPLEAFKQVFDVQLSSIGTSQPPKLAPQEDLHHIIKEPTSEQISKIEEHKSKIQKKHSHSFNGQGMDEKEDFLQQIRAKSFSLRRTAVPEKSSTSCGPAANVNVTAILEKASAIRQVVGSDDGEDDTWSDT